MQREEGDQPLVTGEVSSLNPIRLPCHVDLAVWEPGGQCLVSCQVKIYAYASLRGGFRKGRFTAEISIPAAGSVFRLKYHPPPFDACDDYACSQDVALKRGEWLKARR